VLLQLLLLPALCRIQAAPVLLLLLLLLQLVSWQGPSCHCGMCLLKIKAETLSCAVIALFVYVEHGEAALCGDVLVCACVPALYR
jgi:hypothetical protein